MSSSISRISRIAGSNSPVPRPGAAQRGSARPLKFLGILAASLLVASLTASTAPAAVIDVSLNVLYFDPENAASGGAWTLVAKSDGFGVAGLKVLLTGINTVQNAAPRGTVNGTDPAGFSVLTNTVNPAGFREVNIFQAPIFPVGPGEEQSVFYGVGTLVNGSPNYPMQPPGTNSIGPAFTSLTAVAGVPWATGDPFGDAAWNPAALLLTGSFLPGAAAPGIFDSGSFESRGTTFTTVGTSTNLGTISDSIVVNAIVRSNLVQTADYNGNGAVDAADYVLWRETLGSTTLLDADGNTNGVIDAGDYDVWRANFGTVFGSGSGALQNAAQVPEPGTLGLILAGSLLAIRRRDRGDKRDTPRQSISSLGVRLSGFPTQNAPSGGRFVPRRAT
jgi:hypothetical protein